MANRVRDLAKEQFWRQAVAGQQRSGLSVRAYCAREQFSEPSFYQWRAELARRDGGGRAERPQPPSLRHTDGHDRVGRHQLKRPAFVPVRVLADGVPTAGVGAIDIVLAGGRVVRVRQGFDCETLASVVAVLERARC